MALLACLAGPAVVYCADAKAVAGVNASATLIAPPVNISLTIAAVISAASFASASQLLFSTQTGNLTIYIAGIPARASIQTSCSRFSGIGIICNPATTLQMASDGTLNDGQGISVSLSQSEDDKAVVMAMLAFN
jgi:hypothetical protein